MNNFSCVANRIDGEMNDAINWMYEQYNSYFGSWFQSIRDFHNSISDSHRVITDEELSTILMSVPLDMIACSENLNNIKLKKSLLKLSMKKKKSEDPEYDSYEDDVMISILDCLISRVDKEMSFARELIMSAKKIWDGRRLTEGLNPTDASTSVDSLPDYNDVAANPKHRYIK